MWIATDGYGIHVAPGNPADLKTLTNRQLRKTGVVLDAAVALLFDRRHQLTVADERCGDVSVIGVDAEDVHASRVRGIMR